MRFLTWTGYQPLHQVYILQQDQLNLRIDNGQSGEYEEELFISLDTVQSSETHDPKLLRLIGRKTLVDLKNDNVDDLFAKELQTKY